MLSAVENFGPASAAAAHPYAHHNPFAIAAAAAAAGSAAAAAAAVIPSHHHHHHHHHHQSIKSTSAAVIEHQFGLSHSSLYNNNSVSTTSNHVSNPHLSSGLFLPPPPPTLSLIGSPAVTNTLPSPLVFAAKCSPQERPNSPEDRSPRSKQTNFQAQDGNCPNNMSSAEFARPHPKQPRYSNNSSSNNNNNNIVNATNNNNNSSNHLSNNNNNYNSNAIPLHLRSTKVASNSNKNYNSTCLNNNSNNNNNNNNSNSIAASDKNHCNNNNHKSSSNILNNNNNSNNLVNKTTPVTLPRAKYSNEQSGPVNLVTSNNINSVNHSSKTSRTPPSSISSEVLDSSSANDGNDCSRKPISSDMYAQKLSFSAQSLAAAYQYNYPHLYASRSLYGPSALFPGHHIGHHNTIRPCPTYLGGQHEAFSPYLQSAGVYQTSVPSNVQSQSSVGHLRTAPQVLINNNMLGVGTKPSSPLGRIGSYPQSSPKEISNTNGTYLNEKVNTSPAAPESVSGFKVPSGKEGSLKHRILTRPCSSDRDASKRRSPITASVVRSNGNSSKSNFSKGAYIELANGILRRVEDMRTEDFIQSAEKSAIHQLAESTVVKISTALNSVTITFSYDKNRSKADVEVSQEHPFFVYGQGWASCNPELTLKSFGLRCQRLQVGDICISLISKEHQTPPQSPANNNNNHQTSKIVATNSQPAPSQNFDKSEPLVLPQNLSRKIPPLSAENAIAVSSANSRLANMGAPNFIPPATHHPYDEAAAAAAACYETQISRHHEFYQPSLHLHHSYHRLVGHNEVIHPSSSRLPLPPPLPPPPAPPPQSHSAPVQQTRPPSNQSSYYSSEHHPSSNSASQNSCSNETQQQPVDASLSRKRRWSAPESICDDDESEGPPPPTVPRHSHVNAYNS